MSDIFNAREIMEIAVRVEVNGARFYRKAAQYINVPASKELLLALAEMEDAHEETFRSFIREIEGKKTGEDFIDPEGDAARYLGAVAGGYVFPIAEDPSDKLSGKETLSEIIDFAIGLEKDSVVYYLGVKEIVPPALGRERIDKIITEEMHHITLLSDVKRSL
ncbi:MAG: ferritin family protein [Deltaproteobacteria bacterium]|nr:ferritin family protein [Candidatus Zymogenaceae bacterium]